MAFIKISRVASTELLHKDCRSTLGNFFNENVKMIWHKYPRSNCDKRFATIDFFQSFLLNITKDEIFRTIRYIQETFKPIVVFSSEKYAPLLNTTVIEMVILTLRNYVTSFHTAIVAPVYIGLSYVSLCISKKRPPYSEVRGPWSEESKSSKGTRVLML